MDENYKATRSSDIHQQVSIPPAFRMDTDYSFWTKEEMEVELAENRSLAGKIFRELGKFSNSQEEKKNLGEILEKASTRITRIKKALRINENNPGSAQWSMDHLPDPEEDPETCVFIIQSWARNLWKELQLLETSILREYGDIDYWRENLVAQN